MPLSKQGRPIGRARDCACEPYKTQYAPLHNVTLPKAGLLDAGAHAHLGRAQARRPCCPGGSSSPERCPRLAAVRRGAAARWAPAPANKPHTKKGAGWGCMPTLRCFPMHTHTSYLRRVTTAQCKAQVRLPVALGHLLGQEQDVPQRSDKLRAHAATPCNTKRG